MLKAERREKQWSPCVRGDDTSVTFSASFFTLQLESLWRSTPADFLLEQTSKHTHNMGCTLGRGWIVHHIHLKCSFLLHFLVTKQIRDTLDLGFWLTLLNCSFTHPILLSSRLDWVFGSQLGGLWPILDSRVKYTMLNANHIIMQSQEVILNLVLLSSVEWRKWGSTLFCSHRLLLYEQKWLNIFKISSFVFHRRNKAVQNWRVSKWWQNLYFGWTVPLRIHFLCLFVVDIKTLASI